METESCTYRSFDGRYRDVMQEASGMTFEIKVEDLGQESVDKRLADRVSRCFCKPIF